VSARDVDIWIKLPRKHLIPRVRLPYKAGNGTQYSEFIGRRDFLSGVQSLKHVRIMSSGNLLAK